MVWIVTGVVLGVCALAAVGFFGLRVWRSLRVLTAEVKRVTPLITEAAGPARTELAATQKAVGGRGESLSSAR